MFKFDLEKMGTKLVEIGEELKKKQIELEKKRMLRAAEALKGYSYEVELKKVEE